MSPFQRLGEDLSNSIAGGFDSLKSGAQGAVEGAQTQLGETVTESIGNPLQVSSACQLGHRRNRRCTFHVRAGMTGRVLASVLYYAEHLAESVNSWQYTVSLPDKLWLVIWLPCCLRPSTVRLPQMRSVSHSSKRGI